MDKKHKCELCGISYNLDDGFLNIADICEGTLEAMDYYEEKYGVSLSDFWCKKCAPIALSAIETEIDRPEPEPDYDAKSAEEMAEENYQIYINLK